VHNDSSLSLVALDGNQVVGFIISEIMTNSFGLDQSGWIKIIGAQRMLTIFILSSIPPVVGPLIQHCIIPEPIIPLFQHSNWGEAPKFKICHGFR
jgi:hypothetical protein